MAKWISLKDELFNLDGIYHIAAMVDQRKIRIVFLSGKERELFFDSSEATQSFYTMLIHDLKADPMTPTKTQLKG